MVHQDDHLIVLNKPAGMAVHGGSGVSVGVIEALRQNHPEVQVTHAGTGQSYDDVAQERLVNAGVKS